MQGHTTYRSTFFDISAFIPILSLPPQSLLSFIYLFYNDIFALMNLVSFSVWVTIIFSMWPETLSHLGFGLPTFEVWHCGSVNHFILSCEAIPGTGYVFLQRPTSTLTLSTQSVTIPIRHSFYLFPSCRCRHRLFSHWSTFAHGTYLHSSTTSALQLG